jgi:hypothetical protein
MKDEIALGALISFLVLCVLVLRRSRKPQTLDPHEWRIERHEPWGTAIVIAFFSAPVIGRFVGSERAVLATVALAIGLALYLSRGGTAVRRIAIVEGAIEWDTLRRHERIDLADVIGVSDPDDAGAPPTILLWGGGELRLANTTQGRLLLATLAKQVPVLRYVDEDD